MRACLPSFLHRDSLAKILYSKMFDWLVAAINTAIGEDKDCAASVGVLDIYGFESFEYNDLEQVCRGCGPLSAFHSLERSVNCLLVARCQLLHCVLAYHKLVRLCHVPSGRGHA